eukprot:m51a1_g6602 hypothetical protein (277) ;mRNA; f:323046-324050
MSTRTERIFAAFQGPVLSVGTSVVHMFCSYTAELLIPRRWRLALGLSTEDVVAALQNATARAQPLPTSPPLRCDVCGGVVGLMNPRMCTDDMPDDLESYCATLRSRCTSSKRHLHCSAPVLVVEVKGVLVCSEQFAIFARKPGRQQRRKRAERADLHNVGSCAAGEQAIAPQYNMIVNESIPVSMIPPRLIVVVEVHKPQLSIALPATAMLVIPEIAAAVSARVPGFVLQKTSATKVEDATLGGEVVEKYKKNVITNCLNCDTEGLAQMLARISNW